MKVTKDILSIFHLVFIYVKSKDLFFPVISDTKEKEGIKKKITKIKNIHIYLPTCQTTLCKRLSKNSLKPSPKDILRKFIPILRINDVMSRATTNKAMAEIKRSVAEINIFLFHNICCL